MKKFSFGLLAIGSILSLSILGCQKSNKQETQPTTTHSSVAQRSIVNQNNIVPYDSVGSWHNHMLSQVLGINLPSCNTYACGESAFTGIFNNYISNTQSVSHSISVSDFDGGFMSKDNFWPDTSFFFNNWKLKTDSFLTVLTTDSIIFASEKVFIENLTLYIVNARNSGKSLASFQNGIDSMRNVYNSKGFNTSNGEGILAGYAISVAQHSTAFWINQNTITGNPPAIINIIAGDVAGAIGGGGASLLSDYLHGNSLDWKSAGAWALGGAVAGSCAGPIAGAIRWAISFF